MTTTNKGFETPAHGSNVDTWDVPMNANFTNIDTSFGGVTSLNASGGSAILTLTQYRTPIIYVSGAMAADVTYTIPVGVGGFWMVANGATGAHSLIFASGGGGLSATIPAGLHAYIYSDGTNVTFADDSRITPSTPGGSSGAVQFNDGGAFGGESNLFWDKTNNRLGILNATPTLPLDVAGCIRSSVDGFRFPDNTTQVTAATAFLQKFTASGTFTVPANVTSIKVTVVGPGGDGATTISGVGGGGGGGGTAIKRISGLAPGTPIPVVVGLTAGNNSAFGSPVYCSGLSGETSTTERGGVGGVGSGGDINLTGGGGGASAVSSAGSYVNGTGGSSFVGGGGAGIVLGTAASYAAGGNYGGGGGGTGTGAPGLVIVEW